MLAHFVHSELEGTELRLKDLYKSRFDPGLTANERSSYHDALDRTELAEEIADLEWAEALVLVFPTWWFGFPAILKGWFDRVWAPGVAFDHAPDHGAILPRLHLKHVVAITTMGSPWWADWAMLRPVRRVLKTAILGACATKAKLTWIPIYKAENLTPDRVDRAKSRIREALSFRG